MKKTMFATCVSLLLACDPADVEPADEALEVEAPSVTAAAARPDANPRVESPKKSKHAATDPDVRMPEAKAAFDEIVELVREQYVDGELEGDALWTGAALGVLGRLAQHGDHPINTLLSPHELDELDANNSGKIVGIGVAIEMVADVLVVREVLPGSPSERAKLQAGDRILAIDGERTKGAELAPLVYKIRGESGTSVELFVQRDTEEWTVEIERGEVVFSSVDSRLLDDGVGYLRIGAFADKTAADVDAQLEQLRAAGMTSLVLDVRGCPGGLLEGAVEVADRFLAPGMTIAALDKRDGEQTVFEAKGEYPWQTVPMVVLVGSKTASGAELLAMALADHDRATLVGEPTFGKGTVENVHRLANGWGLKLSTSRFFGPKRNRQHGESVVPDLRIPSDGAKPPVSAERLDLQGDATLTAARQLLTVRAG